MKLIVDNLAIEYSDEGKGPLLLLLHGWGDTRHTFDLLTTQLTRKFRLVRLDLPGFGESETPQETWTVESYVQLVKAFLAKLKLEPEAIVGHSFGGRVTLRGVGEGELVTNKVVLIGSAGIARTKTLKNMFITALSKVVGLIFYIPPMLFFRERLRKWFYRLIGSDYIDAGTLRETYLETIHEDLQGFANRIVRPTLLIWGEQDTATPLADGERLSHIIAKSRLVVVPGATHFVHIEQPERVAREIEEFVG